VTRDKNDIQMS